MRAHVALVLLTATLAACGSSSGETGDRAPPADRRATAAAGRTESCVERMLQRATAQDASEEDLRRYARDTYCARFERNGWIYEDGALSIAAHLWLEEGGTCATGSEGEPTRTVPCEEARPGGPRRLDCALLHQVRRSEVRDYVARLRREGAVECDDGTPLDDLGVP